MYAGHIAMAMAGRRVDDEVPATPFVVATLLPDLFVHRGFHHLVVAPFLTVAAAAVAYRLWRSRPAALACGLLVVSHYVVDFLTGTLQVWTDGTRFGLRLYDRPLADFAMEAVVVVACWVVWRRRFEPADWRLPVVALVVLLGFQASFDALVASEVFD